MDIKQDQAIKRLLKKLSALRATLSNDERALLDGLITTPVDEVEAHGMDVDATKFTTKFTAKPKAADEVEAHGMGGMIIFNPVKDEYERIK